MHRCKRSRDQRAGKTAYLPNLQCRQPRCRGFPIRFRLHIPDLARRLRVRRGGNRAYLWQGRGQSPRHGARTDAMSRASFGSEREELDASKSRPLHPAKGTSATRAAISPMGPGPDQGNITSIARCMLAAWVEWEDHEDLVVVFASYF
jgi:hypothetical protein